MAMAPLAAGSAAAFSADCKFVEAKL